MEQRLAAAQAQLMALQQESAMQQQAGAAADWPSAAPPGRPPGGPLQPKQQPSTAFAQLSGPAAKGTGNGRASRQEQQQAPARDDGRHGP